MLENLEPRGTGAWSLHASSPEIPLVSEDVLACYEAVEPSKAHSLSCPLQFVKSPLCSLVGLSFDTLDSLCTKCTSVAIGTVSES